MAISKKLRFETFKRDGFICQYCGRRPPEIVLEVDHILSRKQKGKDSPENLITACFDCNREKGAKDLKIAPKTIQEKKEILKEKQLQLKEFYKLQQSIQDSIQLDIINLGINWEKLPQGKESVSEHGRLSLKNLLRIFPNFEIEEAMEMAWMKNHIKDENKFKYMCGILWTKKRQREEQGE